MIQLLRRIGFPPFKRTSTLSRSRPIQVQRRFSSTERLEARVLLAADTFDAQMSTPDVADSNHVAMAILSALSGGRDQMIAHAGLNSDSATLSEEVVVPAPVENVFPAEEALVPESAPPVAAVMAVAPQAAEGEEGEIEIQVGGNTFVRYNSINGALRVESTDLITTLEIVSKSGIFTGSDGINLNGTFDIDSDTKIFKLVAEGFLDTSFGLVTQTGLSEEFIRNDLTINGSVAVPDPDNPNVYVGDALSNKIAKLRLQVTNLNRVAIGQVAFNEEFYVRVLTQDKRPYGLVPEENEGVFSAYMDILFDSNLAAVNGDIVFSSDYRNATSGTVGDGLIDEIGAVSTSTSPLDQAEYEVAVIPMRALAAGQLTFIADAADELPSHQTLVFGGTESIDELDIEFVNSQTITITDTPQAPDLVQFAKDLAASGAVFYGASWCSACTSQKELFEDGQIYLPFVEVTNSDRTPNDIAFAENIESYPTWVMPDGSRILGTTDLATLAQAAGISIPQSNTPTFAPIDDVELLSGSPLNIGLDGYDPNGGELTYTITSDNPELVMASLLEGNRSLSIEVQGFGDMVFELFENRAPRVTEQITTLADSGFYDNVIFHRVIDNFVIQGGDPLGTGTGGSDLPDFDDQYHVDLQHNTTGVLSMAKSQDDTNNSQFFITEGTPRHLDFNHSIFGQLVEGESNRQAISNTAVDGSNRPTITVTMKSVDVFDDVENAMLMLKAPEGTSGSANVTVTVEDTDGHSSSQTFAVNVTPDNTNGGPFLDDIPELTTLANSPVTYQLTSQDVEGDPVLYSSGFGSSNVDVSVDENSGLVTITPDEGFVGTATASVRVRAANGSNTSDTFDAQRITVQVLPGAPVVDLVSGSDSGDSDTDNLTNLSELDFEVSNVGIGALVELFADGDKIGEGTAEGTSVVIRTGNLSAFGDGVYEITATQTVDGTSSEESEELNVELDQSGPDGFTSTAPSNVLAGEAIDYNVNNSEEGDIVYSLGNSPAGATIDPVTGVLSWTASSSDTGTQNFEIVATDEAGNTASQTFSVEVDQQQLAQFRLQVTDLEGNPIDAVINGEEFLLQVLVEDLRDDALNLGLFSAYLDIDYTGSAVSVNGDVQFSSDYPNVQFTNTSTDGLIDETGATANTAPLGAGEFLLMSIPMIADGIGDATFTGNPADDLPSRETTLHGLGVGLRADQMVFVDTDLEIVQMTFANDDEFQVDEDSVSNTLDVLENDLAVPTGRTLSVTNVSGTSNATVSINEDQQIVYTPNANFVGTDVFTYEIADNEGDTSSATVTVEVVNVNDDPTANNDNITVDEDSSTVEIAVLNNDSSSPDTGETLTVTEVSQPQNGSAQVTATGSAVTYTPNANFSGSDTFTYTISDGNGGASQANVNVTVNEINDAPIVFRVVRDIDEDSTLSINASELMADALPGVGEADQTLSLVDVDGATEGTLSQDGDVVTFTPPQDFNGELSFNYTVTDNGTSRGAADPLTATGIVAITVNPVNDAPTAVDDIATINAGAGSIEVMVLSNDSTGPDEGETLSIISVSEGSAGGTINVIDGTKIEYTPADDFTEGDETFTYTISDGNGGENTATVTITVFNFVPGGIQGSVMWAGSDEGFAAYSIRLTGVDDTGVDVDLTIETTADGEFSFDTLAPGTYQLAASAPSFTISTSTDSNTIEVVLPAEGLGSQRFEFADRILHPKFAIWEALASSSDTGLYSSVHETDGHEWSQLDTGWDGLDSVDVQFTDDMSSIEITIVEGGQELSTTVSRTDRKRVQVIGQEGDNRLVRINGSRDEFDFQPTEQAEGESIRDQVFADGLW